MRIAVRVPQIGQGQDTATLLRWIKEPGDAVTRGDALAEIETEKVEMEIEALDEGTLVEILRHGGETVAVGEAIAYLEAPDSQAAVSGPDDTDGGSGRHP